jgi:hypothetical protein
MQATSEGGVEHQRVSTEGRHFILSVARGHGFFLAGSWIMDHGSYHYVYRGYLIKNAGTLCTVLSRSTIHDT